VIFPTRAEISPDLRISLAPEKRARKLPADGYNRHRLLLAGILKDIYSGIIE
jgi:hypothetical protein